MITKTAVSGIAALGMLALAFPASAADVIGDVERVGVWAYGTPSGEGRHDLRRNADVHANERIETVKTGEVLIRFEDGTTLGMGSESVIVLDELVFNRDAGDDHRYSRH
ncbi:MAG: hypothetical protein P8Q36_09140 [Alphaproteobacteria bacterium]|jgi:hypothetical protein|nr:hypothetical protein [Rhodospirillaceae bacterium]MDG2481014.1 hypothetical protein [Alphaproteobacteria bacterium]MBT6203216.1 hypothetical protein [Rhodospirillaceae bacterium]MBT6511433.1 hypothetical protein [Rhodospirillaceae bacterium]MBT7612357.1 hypothetical protein [Rhodospirillaceae bacterium]